MQIVLRNATVADQTLVADLSRDTFFETFAPHNSKEDMDKFLAEQFTRGRLMLEVGQPENEFVLAYANNAVAGYLKLRDSTKPEALYEAKALEVARVYVSKPFLGAGVGAALMQYGITRGREKQKDWLWLGVWEKNERAIAFYRKWGFEKFGEWDFLLGNDLQRDWLMRKPL